MALHPRPVLSALLLVVLPVLLPGCAGPSPEPSETTRYAVLFGGDTGYGESYQEEYADRGGENLLLTRGYDHSPARLRPLLLASDLVVVNLETPLTDATETPLTGKTYIHWSDPVRATAAMVRHNVGVVSLANNHAMDYGEAGLDQTMRVLDEAGIGHFGAGPDLERAGRPWGRTIRLGERTVELRVLGGYAYNRKYDKEWSFYAGPSTPGVLPIEENRFLARVRRLRVAEPEAFIVIFPHWGANYRWRSEGQRLLARRLIDAGADLVLGHGAHMQQEIELYRGRWIAYSLGNLMFNSGGRYARFKVPPFSLPARLEWTLVEGELHCTLRFYPILSDNRQTGFQPRFLQADEFSRLQGVLRERSWDRADFDRRVRTGRDRIGPYLEVSL